MPYFAMIYLDTPLRPAVRIYDPHVRWLSPSGLTPNQLADSLLAKWMSDPTVKTRFGVKPSRQAALRMIVDNIRVSMNESVADYAYPMETLSAPRMAPPPPRPKRSKCCGG